ncbi:methionine synthase [Arsenicicoccus dermatophilus]|uniref:methionine synthase n=1 Tax=Arsenicicoccus dermatophilus TaxID=1076331 RepID=UPI0039172FC0
MTRATGMGSWPGTDVRETQRAVRSLLADEGLPYLPELPDRGPGADLIGRAAALLVDLHVDLQPQGWRFVDRAGRDAERTAAWWRQDLDELAETFDGYEGELKVQVAGPLTLAGSVWLHRGERAVVDEGALRDLTGSLAEGVRNHVAEVERLVPGARVVVQLDEPSLPAILAGRLPTASGFGRIRAIDSYVGANLVGEVLRAAGEVGRRAAGERHTVVHCCAKGAPLPLLRSTGAGALAVDTTVLGPKGWESLATTLEAGTDVWLGACPSAAPLPGVGAVRDTVVRRWSDLGLSASTLADVTISPSCGLAGLAPADAVAAQRLAGQVAEAVREVAG